MDATTDDQIEGAIVALKSRKWELKKHTEWCLAPVPNHEGYDANRSRNYPATGRPVFNHLRRSNEAPTLAATPATGIESNPSMSHLFHWARPTPSIPKVFVLRIAARDAAHVRTAFLHWLLYRLRTVVRRPDATRRHSIRATPYLTTCCSRHCLCAANDAIHS